MTGGLRAPLGNGTLLGVLHRGWLLAVWIGGLGQVACGHPLPPPVPILAPREPIARPAAVGVRQAAPGVAPPAPTAGLDKEIIRRVIRSNIMAVKDCYEAELRRNPSLAGRVVVEFVISPSGPVSQSRLERSTMGDAAVESCVVAVVGRWVFPEPHGGVIVKVSYPFTFIPASGASSGSTPPERLADADFAVESSAGPEVPSSERRGSLDKEVIRRVIRRNINAVKYCYETGLRLDRTLAGRALQLGERIGDRHEHRPPARRHGVDR